MPQIMMPNPKCSYIPDEVWDASQRVIVEQDPLQRADYLKELKKIKGRYVINAKTGQYQKDARQNFIKNYQPQGG